MPFDGGLERKLMPFDGGYPSEQKSLPAPDEVTHKQLNLTVKVDKDAKLGDLVAAADDVLGDVVSISLSPYYDYYG